MIFFDDESEVAFERQLRRNIMLRNLRRWLLFVLLLAAFAEVHGTPHIRLANVSGTGLQRVPYWGVTGEREITLPSPPIVVLAPLERSVTDYAGEWYGLGMQEAERQLGALSAAVRDLWELF